MNPDIFQPIVHESQERVKADGFTWKRMANHWGGHHLLGIGPWFRDHVRHGPDAPLRDFQREPGNFSTTK